MYLGRIVEIADRDSLYARPTHPYTRALLSAIPVPDPKRVVERVRMPGETPSPITPPGGCPFHPRCAHTRTVAGTLSSTDTSVIVSGGEQAEVVTRCLTEVPHLARLKDHDGHCHSCLLKQENA
jgi:oligopeptide/dipeptide ABC transporter ATP-binding protein